MLLAPPVLASNLPVLNLPTNSSGEAIQEALDRLPAGGEIVLPPGTFEIHQPIILRHDHLTLRGSGPATILFLADQANCPVVILGSPTQSASNATAHLRIADLQIDGNRKHQQVEFWRCRDRLRRELLKTVAEADITNLKYFRKTSGKIAGVPVDISRTGYTGDLGYEIWIPWNEAVKVWDVLMDKGPCVMSKLVLQLMISALTALKGVAVVVGVKVATGTEVDGTLVIVSVATCVSVLVGATEVLVGARGVTSEVAVIGNGRMIGVGLDIIRVEVGKGVEACREVVGQSSHCILKAPQKITRRQTRRVSS